MAREQEQGWDFGALLLESLEEARAHRRGELKGVRVTRLTARHADVTPAPVYDAPTIAAVRERVGFSQQVFAQVLNVSPKTVQNWEQGIRKPDNAARRLLEIIDKHPEAFDGIIPGQVGLLGKPGRYVKRDGRPIRRQVRAAASALRRAKTMRR